MLQKRASSFSFNLLYYIGVYLLLRFHSVYNEPMFIVGFLMRSLVIFLLLALAGLQYKFWLGDGSVSQWLHLEQKLAVEEQENTTLAARNRAIEADILELKSGEQALEEQARYELGMIKEGELYYQCAD